MFKQKIVIILGIVFLLVVGVFFSNKLKTPEPIKKVYSKAPITMVLDLEINTPVELRIYYTIDKDENFSYVHLAKKRITPKDKHIELVIPEEKIYKFRLDFLTKQAVAKQIELKNVEIIADQYINFNDWESYTYQNVVKTKIHNKGNTVTITASHKDPQMSWMHPFVLYKNE